MMSQQRYNFDFESFRQSQQLQSQNRANNQSQTNFTTKQQTPPAVDSELQSDIKCLFIVIKNLQNNILTLREEMQRGLRELNSQVRQLSGMPAKQDPVQATESYE